ncbi:MAG: 4-phosphoerythronate dehydrogenase [Muribaculaceae bacterium]|nr:4-phosphoerythronate dehydrogenase [Muribaculaceae bacterium]
MNKLVIDNAIPFLRGRIEHLFDCHYVAGDDITPEAVSDASGVLVRTRTRCGRPLLEGSSVEFVATGTIGTDHFDIPWLMENNIDWNNAPGCNAPGVAQYVWSSLLRAGFNPRRAGHNRLGIVGKGNVGSIVAEWGRRLGAEILVCDPPRQEAGHTDEEYIRLYDMAAKVDAITFHTPLTRSGNHPTYHLCSEEIIDRFRPDTIIVNAARGGVVDEAALRRHTPGKHLRLIIDTWEGEPSIDRETLDLTLIATPHIAGYSKQGKQRATSAIIHALERHYGVSISSEELAGAYRPPHLFSPQLILESFDPMTIDAILRENPEGFETQRDSYVYRDELL